MKWKLKLRDMHGPSDLIQSLRALHENAVVAWDRDAGQFDEGITIAKFEDPDALQRGILGYVIEHVKNGRILWLVRAPDDPLKIRWVRWSTQVHDGIEEEEEDA